MMCLATVADSPELAAQINENIENVTQQISRTQEYIDKYLPVAISFGLRLLLTIILFIVGSRLIKVVRKIVRRSMERTGADVGVIQFMDSLIKLLLYFLLIIGFSYFYSTIQFNPVEVANNLKKNGGYIPGFRPGKPTSEFIKKVLNKITLFGAIYLGIIAIVPILISHFSTSASLSGISLGGTSIIIVVGVALETVRALEAQMLMRNYKGFLS